MRRMVFGIVAPALCGVRVGILQSIGRAGGTMSLSALQQDVGVSKSTLVFHLHRLTKSDIVRIVEQDSGGRVVHEVRLVHTPLTRLSCDEGRIFNLLWAQCAQTRFREGIATRALAESSGFASRRFTLLIGLLICSGWIEAHQSSAHTTYVAPSCPAIIHQYLSGLGPTGDTPGSLASRSDGGSIEDTRGNAEC